MVINLAVALCRAEFISSAQEQEVILKAKAGGMNVPSALLALNIFNSADLAKIIAELFGEPLRNIKQYRGKNQHLY